MFSVVTGREEEAESTLGKMNSRTEWLNGARHGGKVLYSLLQMSYRRGCVQSDGDLEGSSKEETVELHPYNDKLPAKVSFY